MYYVSGLLPNDHFSEEYSAAPGRFSDKSEMQQIAL